MKPFLLTLLFIAVSINTIVAQPFNENGSVKDSAVANKMFYFPVSLYKDSIALEKAIAPLATQFLGIYKEDKKRIFYQSTFMYYLLAGNYSKAIEMIDSLRKVTDDMSNAVEFRSYAITYIKEKMAGPSFDKAFASDFSQAFGKLTFKQKVWLAFADTSMMKTLKKDYAALIDKYKMNKSDSLNMKDAQSLLDKYGNYFIYQRIYPLMAPFTNDPQYRASYPAFNAGNGSGVLPVKDVDEFADPDMPYKLLMELSGFAMKDQEDSIAKKEINAGLAEVARVVNLHVAAGVPKKNIDLVIVVHGAAIFALLNNEKYKKRYEVDNPNLALIKDLQNFGAKIIVCGQAMTGLKLEKTDLVPGIKQALTAQTVLSTYQLKNYVHYNESLD